ncbi:MAG: hypothetical protein EXR77_09050 [Myxococcales bacterium]|nr:hypothetical protein [Myxococcales bacterium]
MLADCKVSLKRLSTGFTVGSIHTEVRGGVTWTTHHGTCVVKAGALRFSMATTAAADGRAALVFVAIGADATGQEAGQARAVADSLRFGALPHSVAKSL